MDSNNKNKKVREWMRYSNMAFEMLAIIALFTFIGYQIDKRFGTNKPWLTFVF
ncbi:AtpZ/AtpI family protein [Prolixibacteraceae bacterium JC049]|nr:AtpZ/AtpI family protein [Prolixibacteraceae bacterium JC049]